MNILALDLAARTGWAHTCGASGVWELKIRRDESGGMRLIRLRAKLKEIRESVGVDVIAYEAARHAKPGRQGSLVVQAEMQGVVKAWCLEQEPRVEFWGRSPTEIKKHATGSGIASKDRMLEAARKRWPGKDISFHDEADACFLLDLVCKELGIEWE